MHCELCEETVELGKSTCDHTKNGYCALFNLQAEKDKKTFGPKNYKTLADLQQGDTFRYKNSSEDDWHVVVSIDDEKIYYPGYDANKPYSNYRTDNVEVIVK